MGLIRLPKLYVTEDIYLVIILIVDVLFCFRLCNAVFTSTSNSGNPRHTACIRERHSEGVITL